MLAKVNRAEVAYQDGGLRGQVLEDDQDVSRSNSALPKSATVAAELGARRPDAHQEFKLRVIS